MNFYLGIDFGTSGARAIAINASGEVRAEARYDFGALTTLTLAELWQQALFTIIGEIPPPVRQELFGIAINGTSATVMLCDQTGTPVAEPILYNDARGVKVLETLRAVAPPNHPTISATSSLAKLLWWFDDSLGALSAKGLYFLHQADWLSFLLHGQLGVTDYHNALKLGADPDRMSYPDWFSQLKTQLPHLPRIVKPGTPVAEVRPEIAAEFGLPRRCRIAAGTTDSIAAFLASGAKAPGEASTSLGSTLVLKLLSTVRIDDAEKGIYSHRLGDLWLAGGASNTGGAVLRQFFTHEELAALSCRINPMQESPFDYYPLVKPGERFPVNDPHLPPNLSPRPTDPVAFLHGLLESIARIEARGYELLAELGAEPVQRVYTAGGGAQNPTWTAIRQRQLGVTVVPSLSTEAAFGTALLVRDACL
ncbi:MAG TPA: FGGY-family carbohydrate kinase [Oscillatoriaceae cyanobacterium M33_DOE_052]|uniref:D-ribulose kinase n=1 Tax=Planktothricoides sp. SpSt-374 TaxID=2282167 RepID=A0A7C3ZS81_9CYAN|nr:FGGY-family carbohydrate kinase [Oscillatoriaceae cyanobacterium M33_DOE_052]